MRAFVLGLLAGVALAGAGGYQLARSGCLDRCGEGTRCQAGRCLATVAAAAAPAAASPPERRRHRRRAGGSTDSAGGPEAQLRPGDEAPGSQGDSLGRPERIDLSGNPGDDGAALSDGDIERVFAPAREAISGCIGRAVGDYPLDSGTIEVGYRVERSGRVERVRVTAPALLLRQGLLSCVRPLVTALRFPPSGGASVVTFPFRLQ